MKQGLALLPVAILLLVTCRSTPAPDQGTSTPTPAGTWEMAIKGEIYDQATRQPISGATIRYIVVHSYFPEIQAGRTNKTVSDAQGKFTLPMIVHDTDNIRLRVEADGYRASEDKLDLLGDRSLIIWLTPK